MWSSARIDLPPGGGAPRSESEIYMIAGGNHTLIHRWPSECEADEGKSLLLEEKVAER